MNVGSLIKEARLKKGLTQDELGKIVGVQKSAVAKWENGRVSNIKRSHLQILADTLEIDVVSLLGIDKKENAPTTASDKSIDLAISLFEKLTPEERLEVICYASEILNKR